MSFMQSNDYNPSEIEKKWQEYWVANNTYQTLDHIEGKENFYALSEFAYPSGNLHVGHWYAFAVPDIYARFKRMEGYNVLYPMGFDAFGLPAENAAIKHGKDPKKWTYDNMESMRTQLRSMGASFDWDRQIATCEPSYYKWTQWMFTEFLKHDLVYRDITKVNWCEHDKTILANEQVVAGKCERCGNDVVQKDMAQWMLKITDFADELIDDLDTLNWDESIKQAQREWIGRKEGSIIPFELSSGGSIEVFTTRADTLFGATYLVLAPEHDMVQNLKSQISNWDEVEMYLKEVEKKSDLDRQQSKEKTGVQLKGIEVVNPATGKVIPVWVADYVLAHFGTGAVMAVPAHDERDCEFALKYDLPFKFVILPSAGPIGNSRTLELTGEVSSIIAAASTEEEGQAKINAQWNQMYDLIAEMEDGVMPKGKRFCCSYEGKLINSPGFNVKESGEARGLITDHVNGKITKTYRLRDWGISRQRYWGCPIPVVYNKEEKKNIEKNSFTLNFQNNEYWNELVIGNKTVETRALNPEEPERYFGNIKEGDTLKIVNKGSGEIKFFEVKNCKIFTSFDEYFKDTEILKNAFGGLSLPQNVNELKEKYLFHDSYIEKIEKNGLVAWELEKITPGVKIIPQEHLPWLLPEDVDFTPDGTAPLARSQELLERTETIFGKGWTPEVDTMDTFVDSSWYFYRYLNNNNDSTFASEASMRSWMPVDMYFGGAEHTTMHLLYSRFWTKALHKLGLVTESEPYKGRLNRGLILGPDGNKMSKSKGNVINPDEVVEHVGADTVRMYLAFIGPFNEPGNYPWDPNGVVGIKRFLEKVWRLQTKITEKTDESVVSEIHKTIKKVSDDIERLKLNTAISSMMVLVSKIEKSSGISQGDYDILLQLLAPFAPHLSEELWMIHHTESIHLSSFPHYDESRLVSETIVLPIQINGKRRGEIEVSQDESEDDIKQKILNTIELNKWLEGKEIKKFIYVKNRIINIVVE